jgi:hypothetical protein
MVDFLIFENFPKIILIKFKYIKIIITCILIAYIQL